MYSSHGVQSPAELVNEQKFVQSSMTRGRTLSAYDGLIFPMQGEDEPDTSDVTALCRPLVSEEDVSIAGVLAGLAAASPTGRAHWVDMGGGRGLAMRQVARMPELQGKADMTKVDLLRNIGVWGLERADRQELEHTQRGMTSWRARPRFIRADATTVTLPQGADFITAVEILQYLDDPLGALCNWYNQLNDNGLAIIATGDSKWYGTRYPKTPDSSPERTPNKDLFRVLGNHAVQYAHTSDFGMDRRTQPRADPDNFTVMAIRKKPGTRLQMNGRVANVRPNNEHYKWVTYEPPTEARPLVELIAA